MTVENEHEELVAELPELERLSAEERLKAAKKRRLSQLERWRVRIGNEELFPPIVKANKGRPLKFDDTITLIESAARNDAEEVSKLLRGGMSPDLQNLDGLSALHQAVIEDCDDVVHVLVQGGATLDIKDADLWTPLHAAVACGNADLVKYLVEHGADLVAINADGNMAIDLVDENEEIEVYLDEKMTEKGYTEEQLESIRYAVAEEMMLDLRDSVQKGRELDTKDESGATAMHVAAANGYVDVVEYLLDNGAVIDVRDEDGWQPIHAAVCWGQDAIIELLYNHGADLEAKTDDEETPADLTEDEELLEILKELKDSGRKTVKSVKRTQSNSSRSLCVRRLSLVDKHQTSKNDALNEGIFFQKPEVMNVMINAGEAEDDEEQKRNSLKRESIAKEESEVHPKDSEQRSSFSNKDGLFSAPIRPPSVSHVSGDHPKINEKNSPAIIAVNEENKTEKKTSAPVQEGSVTIHITETKGKNHSSLEPQLVSYQKIHSPRVESSESSGAPVAQPEMDSPLPTSTREAENDQNEANKNVNEDTQRKPKNTADETRNGKLTEKNEATVNKKCCCIL